MVRSRELLRANHTGLCLKCYIQTHNGKLENSPNWNGGIKRARGRVYIYLADNHPFSSMANHDGYVMRSRLVMAEHLGRVLTEIEIVHHEDENKANDDLANLTLFPTQSAHAIHHGLLRRNLL